MEVLVEVVSRVNENEQILDIMEIHARKLLNWRRKEGDRIVDEKYVGEDKIVVREFVVELDPYTDKDIEEFEKEEKRERLNKPRKPRKWA